MVAVVHTINSRKHNRCRTRKRSRRSTPTDDTCSSRKKVLSVRSLNPSHGNVVITDPRELQTIIIFSLRSLFGDMEPYSYQMKVIARRPRKEILVDAEEIIQQRNTNPKSTVNTNNTSNNSSDVFDIECSSESAMNAIHAAITFVTPPPYLSSNYYCLDVVSDHE